MSAGPGPRAAAAFVEASPPRAVRPAAPLCYARMLIRAQRRHRATVGAAAVERLASAAAHAPVALSVRQRIPGATAAGERTGAQAVQ